MPVMRKHSFATNGGAAELAVSAATFDGINRLFAADATPLRWIPRIGLGLVDRAPALKRFFVGEAAGLNGNLPRLLRGERLAGLPLIAAFGVVRRHRYHHHDASRCNVDHRHERVRERNELRDALPIEANFEQSSPAP